MNAEQRLAQGLDRIANAIGVISARRADRRRAERNGEGREFGLELSARRVEATADALWAAIEGDKI